MPGRYHKPNEEEVWDNMYMHEPEWTVSGEWVSEWAGSKVAEGEVSERVRSSEYDHTIFIQHDGVPLGQLVDLDSCWVGQSRSLHLSRGDQEHHHLVHDCCYSLSLKYSGCCLYPGIIPHSAISSLTGGTHGMGNQTKPYPHLGHLHHVTAQSFANNI